MSLALDPPAFAKQTHFQSQLLDYPSTPMAAAGLVVPGRLRRGCVVLVKEARHAPVLASMPLLRPATEGERDEVRENLGSS